MWISKKKYNELIAQKDEFERIASSTVALNDRLLEDWGTAVKEMEELQKSNLRLIELNEGLLARCRELEERLGFMRKERDYYFKLLESTNEIEEAEQ
jgi:hypothetical protein